MRWSPIVSRRVVLTMALVGVAATACKETVTEPIAVASVTVTGGGGTLRLGQSAQLTTTPPPLWWIATTGFRRWICSFSSAASNAATWAMPPCTSQASGVSCWGATAWLQARCRSELSCGSNPPEPPIRVSQESE